MISLNEDIYIHTDTAVTWQHVWQIYGIGHK